MNKKVDNFREEVALSVGSIEDEAIAILDEIAELRALIESESAKSLRKPQKTTKNYKSLFLYLLRSFLYRDVRKSR